MAKWTPERIRALRAALGLTQKQLAARLHVAVSTVGRWEIGQTAPVGHLEKQLERLERQAQKARGEE